VSLEFGGGCFEEEEIGEGREQELDEGFSEGMNHAADFFELLEEIGKGGRWGWQR
jgi:hypothetical protein